MRDRYSFVSLHPVRHGSVGEVCLSLMRKNMHTPRQTCVTTSTWLWTWYRSANYPAAQHSSQRPIMSCGICWLALSHSIEQIAFMMIHPIKASKKTFGYSFQIFDPGKWITIDPWLPLSCVSFSDWQCGETCLFVDTWWLTTLCTRSYPGVTQITGDLETAEFVDVFGVIVEEFRLTRCVRVCFADKKMELSITKKGRRDPLGDQDMEQRKNHVLEEVDQMGLTCLNRSLFPSRPESEKDRSASWFSRRARAAIRHLHRTCDIYPKKDSCSCYVLSDPIRLHQCSCPTSTCLSWRSREKAYLRDVLCQSSTLAPLPAFGKMEIRAKPGSLLLSRTFSVVLDVTFPTC